MPGPDPVGLLHLALCRPPGEIEVSSNPGAAQFADQRERLYAIARLGDEGTALKDMESGEQRDVETGTVMHHITR